MNETWINRETISSHVPQGGLRIYRQSASGAEHTSFAAGAMLYVVVEELIPEMSSGEHSHIGVIFFAVGCSLMMALDVALG